MKLSDGDHAQIEWTKKDKKHITNLDYDDLSQGGQNEGGEGCTCLLCAFDLMWAVQRKVANTESMVTWVAGVSGPRLGE